jgi:hypothetical protein
MKKKIFITVAVLALIVLLGPRFLILSMATWEYFHTDLVCTGRDPTPPAELGEQFPFPLYEVGPYKVITDRGYMYPGDEYRVWGESWFGMVTLLWAGGDGAVFTVTFESNNPVTRYSRPTCRWFPSLGDYR